MRSSSRSLRTPLLVLPVAVLLLSGCRGEADQLTFQSGEAARAAFSEASVSITSTDGVLRLALVGDSVVMALSDSLRASVSEDMESGGDDRSGLGKAIVGVVGAAVEKALSFAVTVPATAIRDLRYEDGDLRFDVDNGSIKINNREGTGADKEGTSAAFSEAAALEFIEAVRAAQERLKGQ